MEYILTNSSDNITSVRRGRIIPRTCTVYEDLHTILAQYDEYRRKNYHRAEADSEDEEEELTREQITEKKAEKRR